MIPLAVPNVDGKEAAYLQECIDSTFVSVGTTGMQRSEGGHLGAERQGVRDDEILAEAKTHGTTADRSPSGLADDRTPTIDVLREYLERRPHVDAVVVLQPTSPLRSADDIRSCLDSVSAVSSAVTGTPCEHPPNLIFRMGPGDWRVTFLGWDGLVPNRQTAEAAYRLNGAVYAVSAGQIRDDQKLPTAGTVAVSMPMEPSIDVDTPLDLAVARLLARDHHDWSTSLQARPSKIDEARHGPGVVATSDRRARPNPKLTEWEA